MATPTRSFPLRVVLTVTTGRLLTHGIKDLQCLLEFMTGERPLTHQLDRFIEECKPWLIRWHPALGVAERRLPILDQAMEIDPSAGSELWLTALEQELGTTVR